MKEKLKKYWIPQEGDYLLDETEGYVAAYLAQDVDPMQQEMNRAFNQVQAAKIEAERKLELAVHALQNIYDGAFSEADCHIAKTALAIIESQTVDTSSQVQTVKSPPDKTGPDWDKAHQLEEQMLPAEGELEGEFEIDCRKELADMWVEIGKLKEIVRPISDKV